MSRRWAVAAYWAPRLVCLGLVGLMTLLAVDAELAGGGWWESLLGVALHLVPALVVLVALVISWRRDLVGAGVFLALAVAYLALAAGKVPAAGLTAIAAPILSVAALFLLSRLLNPPAPPGPPG